MPLRCDSVAVFILYISFIDIGYLFYPVTVDWVMDDILYIYGNNRALNGFKMDMVI